ncbi:MAG TPA: hypothetical protein VG099_24690, partial [Gemmataceae bacterium]|nr:hypothetical protein [Gemmataceae bacterium]
MAFEILTYNTVPLQILASKEKIGRRHVMSDDRTTYLHTEWVFDVITQLNPATMGLIQNLFTTGALAGLAGTSGVNMPATIDAFLRIILNRPRGSLVFSQSSDGVNYNVVLNVPNNPANLTGLAGTQTDPNAASNGGVAFLTDCTGGPIV